MFLCSLPVLLCLLHAFCITADIDSGSFLIFNEDHNKCVRVESATSMTVAPCDPNSKSQRFRWASESRLLSLSLNLCVGATEIKDWVKVLLFECDEKSQLQHWDCKNDTLFGLKDQELYFNWGNKNERNIMVYKGSGVWSRWRAFGTKVDICTKGYQETFTIGGNSFGSPCQFPFKLNDKWYSECTVEGRSDGQLWCSTDADYNKSNKWGFCPTNGTKDWTTDPVTGVQYQRNLQSALSWHQARKSCQQQGADLLSIVELHEQSFIAGLVDNLGSTLWIGLNSLSSGGGWEWSNGHPFRYLNWAPGSPSSDPLSDCATLNSAKASKWESKECSKKLGYICRKENPIKQLPVTTKDQPSFCPNLWVPFAGHCYFLERSKHMWKDALNLCRKEGGDLASINNIEEQSFIISRSGYLPTDQLWIGMNDQRVQLLFEWSDRSPVTFAQWDTDEPSQADNLQEDCVLLQGQDGGWADHRCDKSFGYICKKKASKKAADGAQKPSNTGCKPGAMRFRSHCYSIGTEMKTFDGAQRECSSFGANLVDINDRYENAFLISLVGMRPEKYFWTGFSNTDDRHIFRWFSRRKVTFTHFNVGLPDRRQGCVAFTTGIHAGLWDIITCNSSQNFICKRLSGDITTTAMPPTTPALYCHSGWTPFSKRSLCYKVYRKAKDYKKSWSEAQSFCRAVGGELASIHSKQDLHGQITYWDYLWIGLRMNGPNEAFTWSDGSPFSYNNWNYGEPNYDDAELCVELKSYERRWEDRYCDIPNDWICQIRKGQTPKPEPVDSKEVYNKTADGWVIYNDNQYYINLENMDMEDARAFCKSKFSDLAVIKSDSERRFIWRQIHGGNRDQYYIGMIVNLDKSFSWLDGTPVTYTAWERNEPNFANNDENCVSINTNMGFWNDINCDTDLRSICKRSNNFINTTMSPATVPRGGCAPGWVAFNGKCYKFTVGKDTKLSWRGARTKCMDLGGNLVSIRKEKEQAFITSRLANAVEDFWIGMNIVTEYSYEDAFGQFVWTDGKGISFTNWAKGQPNHNPNLHLDFDCVMMAGIKWSEKGLWKLEECARTLNYICKRNIDLQIAIPPPTDLTKSFFKLGNDSYKLVAQKMSWEEARRQCQADDADLVSVLSPVVQSYLALQIDKYNEPVWIGLNSNVTAGRYKWVDNWILLFTKWGRSEPNYACAYMDLDKTWKTAPCTNTYYSFCKISTVTPPTGPPQLPGKCPESTRVGWIPFRGFCYSFVTAGLQDWAHSTLECMKIGGSLVSIKDPEESHFIKDNLEHIYDRANSFWIGLIKTHEDTWMWIDGSVVDFTNWMPNAKMSDPCVSISSESGQWTTLMCHKYISFICKTPKVVVPTEKPALIVHAIEEITLHGSPGVTVTVVLVVIAALGLCIFLIFRKKIPTPTLGESAAVDTKGLVPNIEEKEQAGDAANPF